MYTLKIAWTLHEFTPLPDNGLQGELIDETTLFIPADVVKVLNSYDGEAGQRVVAQWVEAGVGILDYSTVRRCVTGDTGTTHHDGSRMIEVERNGVSTWYLASRAWLLGPEGGTIERVAP